MSTSFNWREFLQRWSDQWLATNEKFPARVRKIRWLGFPPATDRQLLQLEKRLGYELPPSYRNFLLTTNGWRRTSTFIEQIRPASKVEWLESAEPELLDVWAAGDDGDSMSNYSPTEYFAYDGRPIFDNEHFRKSLLIADPIAGDSMIYVLNPMVVAPDGEWEAWQFASWIPGAVRFPSFELLMRSEYEAFQDNHDSQQYLGPYEGKYAPDQPRHAARAIGPGCAKPRRLTIPELIEQLESPNRATRLKASKHLLREFRPHNPEDEHPEIVEPLSRILRSGLETDVRSAAAAMLGSYGDSGAIGPLVDALDDESVRGIALSALSYLSLYMKDSRIADAMFRILDTPGILWDTEHAVHILQELKDPRVAIIGLRLLDNAPLVIPHNDEIADFSQAQAYQRGSIRSLGAFAFARFAPNAADELVRRLSHPNAEIRLAATAALRELPDKNPDIAQHVAPLLSDMDPLVQQQAATTLRFLEPAPKVEVSPSLTAELEAQVLAQLTKHQRKKNRF